ncbi:MAG: hypothetical protein B6D55_07515, partial [Candidatus Omnitrophica bacterium 4484_70.2]
MVSRIGIFKRNILKLYIQNSNLPLTNSTYEVELGNVEMVCKNKAFILKIIPYIKLPPNLTFYF